MYPSKIGTSDPRKWNFLEGELERVPNHGYGSQPEEKSNANGVMGKATVELAVLQMFQNVSPYVQNTMLRPIQPKDAESGEIYEMIDRTENAIKRRRRPRRRTWRCRSRK